MRMYRIRCYKGAITNTLYKVVVWAPDVEAAFRECVRMGYSPISLDTP
jgi:hypothetical protein